MRRMRMKFRRQLSNLGRLIATLCRQLRLEAKRRNHLEAVSNPSLFPSDEKLSGAGRPGAWLYDFETEPGRRLGNQYPTKGKG